METQLTIQPHENGRTRIAFEIKLSADETTKMEAKKCSRHMDSAKPVPCQFYQTPDTNIKVVKGAPEFNGPAVKCYVLAGARSVALNRCIPGKTLLRIMFPGKTELGFANASETGTFKRWWEETEKEIKKELKARLFSTVDSQDAPRPMAPVEHKTETKLNPLDPSENGVRRRSLEEF